MRRSVLVLYMSLVAALMLGSAGAATLVRHYPLDGDANEMIVPGTGTLFGSPPPTFITDPAVGTHAIRFPGVQSIYANSPCGISWGREDSFALSVWIRRGTLTRREMALSQSSAGTWFVDTSTSQPGRLAWVVRGTDNSGYHFHWSTRNDLMDNQWHMFTIVHDATQDHFRLYVDGELDKTTLYSQFTNALNPGVGWGNATGRVHFGGWSLSSIPWTGDVDDFRIYDGALTDQQVMDLFRGTSVPHSPSPKDRATNIGTLDPVGGGVYKLNDLVLSFKAGSDPDEVHEVNPGIDSGYDL